MKSGNLNFLEPSGPLQAYNGIALPFTAFPLQQWLRERDSALRYTYIAYLFSYPLVAFFTLSHGS